MKQCKTCKYWNSPHEGMWDSNDWGTCNLLTSSTQEGLDVVTEGCVHISARVAEYEIATLHNFGCNKHKARSK